MENHKKTKFLNHSHPKRDPFFVLPYLYNSLELKRTFLNNITNNRKQSSSEEANDREYKFRHFYVTGVMNLFIYPYLL